MTDLAKVTQPLPNTPVVVTLTDAERAAILVHAKNAMVGGTSSLYGNSIVRENELRENQVVAMACEGAFAKWAGDFGSFLRRRAEQDKHPHQGDHGRDHILSDGRRIDVKGSEANGTQDLVTKAPNLCLTHLPRKAVIDEVVYVLAVTRRRLDDKENEVPDTVVLVGWLYGHELRGREDSSILKGWSARGNTLRDMEGLKAPMKFTIIVADPAWKFGDTLAMSSVKRGAAANYQTIATADLLRLDIKDIVAENAVLALWCPSSMLEDGLAVGRAWGFPKFSTIWTWVKQNPSGLLAFGMGHTFRGATEHVLIFRRGRKIPPKEHRRNVYIGPPLKPHSAKPEALQDDLDAMYPEGERLELFARRERPNWKCSGLELDGFDVRDLVTWIKEH